MVVIALLLPVAVLLMLFGLEAFEDHLFPASPPSASEVGHEGTITDLPRQER